MQMNHECAYFEELHVFQRDCATITPSTRTRDFHKRGVSFKQQRQHCPDRASWATGIGSLCFVQQRRVAVCVCVCVSISRRVLRVSASIKERRLVAQELPAKCPARIPLVQLALPARRPQWPGICRQR